MYSNKKSQNTPCDPGPSPSHKENRNKARLQVWQQVSLKGLGPWVKPQDKSWPWSGSNLEFLSSHALNGGWKWFFRPQVVPKTVPYDFWCDRRCPWKVRTLGQAQKEPTDLSQDPTWRHWIRKKTRYPKVVECSKSLQRWRRCAFLNFRWVPLVDREVTFAWRKSAVPGNVVGKWPPECKKETSPI